MATRTMTPLTLLLLLASSATIGLLPDVAAADTRLVDCSTGRRIATALRVPAGRQLTITVRGTCVENVEIRRDDVVLKGQTGASLRPADANRPTILIEAARQVRIEGLTITGGAGGIVGTRGAIFDVAATANVPSSCTVQGGTRFGIVASFGSSATVDGCTVQDVSGDGLVAANSSSIAITNSTVQNNTGSGVVGTRTSHVRIGQDTTGAAVLKPVNVIGNHGTGVVVSDSSAGIIAGGSVRGSSTGIFVGRASSAQIGAGAGGLVAGVIVESNAWGITVEGGAATILGSRIADNDKTGIVLLNGGSARIGIKDSNSGYVANEITGNGLDGILVSTGSSALIGGNTIRANGTDTTPPIYRYGINVSRSNAILVGGNTIADHPSSGVFVTAGSLRIGDASFGLPTANTISGNGATGRLGALGGIFAFQGGRIDVYGALLTGNYGNGAQAYEQGHVEIREGTTISGTLARAGQAMDFFDGGNGINAGFRSTVRLRQSTSVTGNTGHGVMVTAGSGVSFTTFDPSAPLPDVSRNAGFGLQCFGFETSYMGTFTGILAPPDPNANTLGAINTTNCSGF